MTRPSRCTACWPRAWRPTTPGATSPSISIPRARFSDGQPVLADDVLFSWALLRDKGRPNHRQYYSKVAKAEAPDPLTVRFDFGGASDRELPLILGLMPILPRHATDVATFEETSMTPPIGYRPLSRHRGQARRQRHVHAQSRLLGPRSAGQPRLVEFRRDQARISIARPTASSKPSSAACTIFASRPSRCAGTTVMIFRPRATAR